MNWLNDQQIQVDLLNLGGGFGIKYVEEMLASLLKAALLKSLMQSKMKRIS